jgi:hypothetical protein
MAVLGTNGIIRFRREAPDPIVVPSSALRSDLDVLLVGSQEFWNGDEVYVLTPEGLPLSPSALPSGVGCYFGSRWDLGPNRTHVTAEDDQYYQAIGSNGAYFYNRGQPVHSATYYIYRDRLDRISFYISRADALRGDPSDRIDLRSLDFQYMVIAPAGTQEYENALAECVAAAGPYRFSDVRDEVTLASICDFPPLYLQPAAGTAEYDNAELEPRRWINGFPWIIQGCVAEWTLDLDGSSLNTTAVGDRFGENIKALVTGGGSLDFDIDRKGSEDRHDGTFLMQLLLLTEKGCKAEAEFYMIYGRQDDQSRPELLPGDLYYQCEILVTSNAISTRPGEIIVGSASFVTTGPIELRMGT